MKKRSLFVKKTTVKAPNPSPEFNFTGYGITDGKKWYVYAYATESKANDIATTIMDGGDDCIIVNVGYTSPVRIIRE